MMTKILVSGLLVVAVAGCASVGEPDATGQGRNRTWYSFDQYHLLPFEAVGQLRVITPDNAEREGWRVEVECESNLISFAVSNARWNTNAVGKADAMLNVKKSNRVLYTVELGHGSDKGRPCFRFALAPDLVKESTLEIPANQTRAASYQVDLDAFLSAWTSGKTHQRPSTGDVQEAAPER